jgi:hypothetical protein
MEPLILLRICMLRLPKSCSLHPTASENVKNAQFSRILAKWLWDGCETVLLSVGLIGLSAFCAKAQSPDTPAYDILNFTLTATMPALNSGNTVHKGTDAKYTDTTKYITRKVKITNKDILALLAADNGASFVRGAKLVGSEGSVQVVDSKGKDVLYSPDNFSYGSQGDYDDVISGTHTETHTGTGTKAIDTEADSTTATTIGNVTYQSPLQTGQFFDVSGKVITIYTRNYSHVMIDSMEAPSDTSTEKVKSSFTGTGAGWGLFAPAEVPGVVSGTITGTKSYSFVEKN